MQNYKKQRDILISRILGLSEAYCPHSLEPISNIPGKYPELRHHCTKMGSCPLCWKNWVEQEECNPDATFHDL